MRAHPPCLLLVLVSLASCKGTSPPSQASAEPSPTETATEPAAPAAANAPAPAAPTTTGELEIGKPPPPLAARSHDGVQLELAAMKGKPVVIYFYPRDETPGCTKQACSFRDAWADLAKHDAVLIGISTDTDESHRAFAKRHQLPFHLVSDPRGELARAFGVPVERGVVARQTFIVGRDGNLVRIDREVDVRRAAADALAAVAR
jgi:thioredoxin-dependent peroxiredoxin